MTEQVTFDPTESNELFQTLLANIDRTSKGFRKEVIKFRGIVLNSDIQTELYDIYMANRANVRGTITKLKIDQDMDAINVENETIIMKPNFNSSVVDALAKKVK